MFVQQYQGHVVALPGQVIDLGSRPRRNRGTPDGEESGGAELRPISGQRANMSTD